ncbi:uncharacterized protein BDZ99DRAFT_232132 [Mytilinidion resinicola]|uniref:Uncharacterized protein n=1 Tax=Mytilinidion resinicola TaxID=574789 RepID=A0A6A6YZH1_9PEZI|nr:uncharacterized protein BDZ99DRAFT_232132 [Mytilinidion resinicola]KAF2814150.1 hypothetical protein BDZ99DRAFT_232132 [Mytilinidion resinicola]
MSFIGRSEGRRVRSERDYHGILCRLNQGWPTGRPTAPKPSLQMPDAAFPTQYPMHPYCTKIFATAKERGLIESGSRALVCLVLQCEAYLRRWLRTSMIQIGRRTAGTLFAYCLIHGRTGALIRISDGSAVQYLWLSFLAKFEVITFPLPNKKTAIELCIPH